MLYSIIGILVIIFDQLVKYWVDENINYLNPSIELIPNVLSLVRVQNDGAAFSFLQGGGAYLFRLGGVFGEFLNGRRDRFGRIGDGLHCEIGEKDIAAADIRRIDDRNAAEKVFDAHEHRTFDRRQAESATRGGDFRRDVLRIDETSPYGMFQLVGNDILGILFLIGNPPDFESDQMQGFDLRRQRVPFERRKTRDVKGIELFRTFQDRIPVFVDECVLIAENGMQSER